MKKKVCAVATVFIFLTITAFQSVDDIIARLGLNASAAQHFILGNFTGNFNNRIESYQLDESEAFKMPYSKAMLPALIAGDKVKAAEELCSYIKKYCNSYEFMTEYNKGRISALPLSDNGVSAGSLQHNIDVYQTNIKNYKTNQKYVDEQQKLLDADQHRLDKLLEKSNGNFPLKNEWEETFPADASVAVKRRLQEYLAIISTVDFNAKLTEPDRYNKRKFANPVYEKKNLKWKAVYRAGKDVNDAVTVFVKDWLKGEIISKQKLSTATNDGKADQTVSDDNNSSAVKTNNTSASQTGSLPPGPSKEKKSFFNKMKAKAKDVVN